GQGPTSRIQVHPRQCGGIGDATSHRRARVLPKLPGVSSPGIPMRPLILLSVLTLTVCGGGGLARGDDAPACASVAAKQRAVEKTDKDYEDIRERTVGSPTEKNQ